MIGNDIVDLQCAGKESNWQRPGFLQKVFNPSEVALLYHADSPDLITWLMWSMKESVYKIISRQEHRRFFTPKKIICQICTSELKKPLNRLSAIVSYKSQYFSTTSLLTDKFIHTIARKGLSEPSIQSDCSYIVENNYQSQHHSLRQNLIEHYAAYTRFDPKYLSIRKDAIGIPHLFFKNQKQNTVLSLSHHGNHVGFAYTLERKTLSGIPREKNQVHEKHFTRI